MDGRLRHTVGFLNGGGDTPSPTTDTNLYVRTINVEDPEGDWSFSLVVTADGKGIIDTNYDSGENRKILRPVNGSEDEYEMSYVGPANLEANPQGWNELQFEQDQQGAFHFVLNDVEYVFDEMEASLTPSPVGPWQD